MAHDVAQQYADRDRQPGRGRFENVPAGRNRQRAVRNRVFGHVHQRIHGLVSALVLARILTRVRDSVSTGVHGLAVARPSAVAQSSAVARSPPVAPADARGRDALQRENEALRRANARLNARLDSAETNQQEIIDRYERLLAERRDGSRKQTRGRSARRNDRSRRSGVESNAADAVRSAVGRVVEGVASALGRR